jgi:hypothetical protein
LTVNGGTVVAHADQTYDPVNWYDSGSLVIGRWNGGNGVVTVHGTAEVPAALDVWGRTNIGDGGGSVGSLTLSGTATMATQGGAMRNWGWWWGDGGWVTVGCSEWYEGGNLHNWWDGGTNFDAGGTGTLTLKDTAHLQGGGGLQIGRFGGTGTFTMTDSATGFMWDSTMIGTVHDSNMSPSHGTWTMDKDSQYWADWEVYIGHDYGHGELTMRNNAKVTNAYWTQVGRDGGVGVVKMYDDTSFTAIQEFRIGRSYPYRDGTTLAWVPMPRGNGSWYLYNNAAIEQKTNDWFLVGHSADGYLEANDYATIKSQWAIDIGDTSVDGADYQAGNGKVVLNGHSSMTVVADGLWIGNGIHSVGELVVNDFATVNLSASEIEVPFRGQGTMTIGNGNDAVVTCPQVLLGWSADSTSGVINMNAGGTLVTHHIYTDSAPLQSIINMNGGTLKATGSTATFVSNGGGALDYQFNVKEGGAKIDSNGFNVAITVPVTGSATDGGLQKLGVGILTLTAPINVTGASSVAVDGTLSIDNGSALNTMGTITGAGTLDIGNTLADTVLTADSIAVDSLVIGAGTPVVYAAADLAIDRSSKLNHRFSEATSKAGEVVRHQIPGAVAPVPEPSTIVMLVLAGLGALLAWRRK